MDVVQRFIRASNLCNPLDLKKKDKLGRSQERTPNRRNSDSYGRERFRSPMGRPRDEGRRQAQAYTVYEERDSKEILVNISQKDIFYSVRDQLPIPLECPVHKIEGTWIYGANITYCTATLCLNSMS